MPLTTYPKSERGEWKSPGVRGVWYVDGGAVRVKRHCCGHTSDAAELPINGHGHTEIRCGVCRKTIDVRLADWPGSASLEHED